VCSSDLASEPKAASGYLCVYVGKKTAGFLSVGILTPYSFADAGAGTSGAALEIAFLGESQGSARGSWAVTG